MEREQLCRRLQDLAARCEKTDSVVVSTFLTPTEQAEAAVWAKSARFCRLRFYGGHRDCERKAAFFLPFDLEEENLDYDAYITAVEIRASFGVPAHRDYLGALLALGVKREWIGDIRIKDQLAWVFCLPSVAGQLCELTKAGKVSVKARLTSLSDVPDPERKRKQISFTVQSLRFDAVLAETFGLSRAAAVKQIAAGSAYLDYLPCLKADAPISEGTILSLRGFGKAEITEIGGNSRKGRTFVHAELYL